MLWANSVKNGLISTLLPRPPTKIICRCHQSNPCRFQKTLCMHCFFGTSIMTHKPQEEYYSSNQPDSGCITKNVNKHTGRSCFSVTSSVCSFLFSELCYHVFCHNAFQAHFEAPDQRIWNKQNNVIEELRFLCHVFPASGNAETLPKMRTLTVPWVNTVLLRISFHDCGI